MFVFIIETREKTLAKRANKTFNGFSAHSRVPVSNRRTLDCTLLASPLRQQLVVDRRIYAPLTLIHQIYQKWSQTSYIFFIFGPKRRCIGASLFYFHSVEMINACGKAWFQIVLRAALKGLKYVTVMLLMPYTYGKNAQKLAP